MRRVDARIVDERAWSSALEPSGTSSLGIGPERSANATLAKLVPSATFMVSPCKKSDECLERNERREQRQQEGLLASCKNGDFPPLEFPADSDTSEDLGA